MTDQLRVAVIDDHGLVREGLVATCNDHPGVEVVYESDDLAGLESLDPVPNLVLLDLDLHGTTVTAEQAQAIIARGSMVLIVSGLGSATIVRAMLKAGIAGFVSKRDSSTSLHEAIDAVIAGELWTSPDLAAILAQDPDRPQLSEQEQRALVLYASGLKMQSVARQLGVKPTTAKEYIERVRLKYAAVGRPAPTKVHLYSVAQEDGLLDTR